MGAQDVGSSAKGVFHTPTTSHRYNWRRKHQGALDRFAAELAKHSDQGDVDAGRATELDPGGDTRACARRIGARPEQGPLMLQRIRKRLGWQAV